MIEIFDFILSLFGDLALWLINVTFKTKFRLSESGKAVLGLVFLLLVFVIFFGSVFFYAEFVGR